MNLYLYILLSSEHPSGMIKGLIYSAIRRYKRQNTDRKDYVEMVRLLYQQLRDCRWGKQQLYELLIEVVNTINNGMTSNNQQIEEDKSSFIHCQHLPDSIIRQELQHTFENVKYGRIQPTGADNPERSTTNNDVIKRTRNNPGCPEDVIIGSDVDAASQCCKLR
eukprot:5097052-Ditylum_brightwellii.AAC.1